MLNGNYLDAALKLCLMEDRDFVLAAPNESYRQSAYEHFQYIANQEPRYHRVDYTDPARSLFFSSKDNIYQKKGAFIIAKPFSCAMQHFSTLIVYRPDKMEPHIIRELLTIPVSTPSKPAKAIFTY